MMVAEEVLVVAEHQQEIAGPENHVQFHEGDDTGMMRQWTGGNLILLERKRTRCHQLELLKLHPFLGWRAPITIIHMPKVAGRMRYSGRVTTSPFSISGCVPQRVACESLEQEFYPTGPEEQTSEKSRKSLFGVSLYEDTDYYHDKTCQPHEEG